MVRLIIFLGPVASALAGVFLGATVDWTAPLLLEALLGVGNEKMAALPSVEPGKKKKGGKNAAKRDDDDDDAFLDDLVAAQPATRRKLAVKKKAMQRPKKATLGIVMFLDGLDEAVAGVRDAATAAKAPILDALARPRLRVARTVAAACALAAAVHYYKQFSDYAWSLAEGMSQPSIMFRAHLRNGTPEIVDDYRE